METITTARLGAVRTLAAACLVTFLAVPPAWAGIQPQPFRTGLFGVTAGHSIRISILNAGETGGVIDPCFRVLDATGALLSEVDGGPLAGGAATFIDFIATPGGAAGARLQLRAEVVFEPATDGQAPANPAEYPPDPVAVLLRHRSVLVSLEVFDTATGQTVFTTPFAAVAGIEPTPFAPVAGVEPTPFTPPWVAVAGINPQPFKTGLFGVREGQSIRVSVLNAGEAGGVINPCVRVFDLDGTLLFEADAVPLAAGAGAFMDFNALPPGPTRIPGSRSQVRVEVELVPTVYPPDPIATPRVRRSDFHLTVEVFDIATGQTVYTMPFVTVGFNPQPEPPEPVR